MTALQELQYWQSIGILVNNYHVLNKSIFQVLITDVQKRGVAGQLCDSNEAELEKQLQSRSRTCIGFKVSFKLLTKRHADNFMATGVLDFNEQTYQCTFECNTLDDFLVQFRNGQIDVSILTDRTEADQAKRWADCVLKPKLLSWALSKSDGQHINRSLQLLNVEQYNDLYKKLKQKHAERLSTYWQAAAESTDPLKFIYEDIAIAAYLITLWQCTQSEPEVFADLGCGNGLLVHILNAEGYNGYGVDIRKRKLWQYYPEDTKLIEKAVDPNDSSLSLPKADWLIGNHSDELSPWLPVMAARLKTKFFLLPCCAYELSGAKYQRRDTCQSAYQDFFKYVRQVSQKCGFETHCDRLKIPSTKRLALIGFKCTPKDQEREYFIQQELQTYKIDDKISVKLRERTEAVRNCTQVDQSIINSMVLKIFQMLLPSKEVNGSINDTWMSGQRLSMLQIAEGLTKEDLKSIKSECGGIKTLLRNKHEIFEFCGNNEIGVRKPVPCTELLKTKKTLTIRKRLCFFKEHHPQGCPLSDAECSFIH